MKRTLFIMLAMGFLLIGCQMWRDTTVGTFVTYGQYPECKNEASQGDFVNCVKAIQEKEGKAR